MKGGLFINCSRDVGRRIKREVCDYPPPDLKAIHPLRLGSAVLLESELSLKGTYIKIFVAERFGESH